MLCVWNPNVDYRVWNCLPLGLTMNQMNPVHTLTQSSENPLKHLPIQSYVSIGVTLFFRFSPSKCLHFSRLPSASYMFRYCATCM